MFLLFWVFFFFSESSVLTEWPHPALVFGKITCCMSCPWRGDRTPLSRSNGVCIGIEVETTNWRETGGTDHRRVIFLINEVKNRILSRG